MANGGPGGTAQCTGNLGFSVRRRQYDSRIVPAKVSNAVPAPMLYLEEREDEMMTEAALKLRTGEIGEFEYEDIPAGVRTVLQLPTVLIPPEGAEICVEDVDGTLLHTMQLAKGAYWTLDEGSIPPGSVFYWRKAKRSAALDELGKLDGELLPESGGK